MVCQGQFITLERKRKFEELCCFATLIKSCPSAEVSRSLRSAVIVYLHMSFQVLFTHEDSSRLVAFMELVLLVASGALPYSVFMEELDCLKEEYCV